MFNNQIKIGKPFKNQKLNKLISFLNVNDLTYDVNIEYSIIIEDFEDNIIATGSLEKNIIKCVAVDKTHRNENLTSTIITHLFNHSVKNGNKKLFLFTKLKNELQFKNLGFYTIEKTNQIVLMENTKNGLSSYLDSIKQESLSYYTNKVKKVGCIIANCNPFTNGHSYLIETAAKECDLLHVFILSGDNNFFNEEERFNLVRAGTKNIPNILLHHAKEYILSPLTFPTYFIKDKKQTTNINCKLDINLFLNKLVPLLKINYRFVGTEPKDLVTNSYNNELINGLVNSSVKLIIIERKKIQFDIISATKVRFLIENKDFKAIIPYVPKTTYDFIISKFDKTSSSKK